MIERAVGAEGGEEVERLGQAALRHRVGDQFLEHEGVGHEALAHEAQAFGGVGGGVFGHDHAQDRGGAQRGHALLEGGELRVVDQGFRVGQRTVGGVERLVVLGGRQIVAAAHEKDGRLVDAVPKRVGWLAFHLRGAQGEGEQGGALGFGGVGGAEGHAAVPHHGHEVAAERLALGVVAARHVLAPVFAVGIGGEDGRRADLLVRGDGGEVGVGEVAQALRHRPIGVEQLDGYREVGGVVAGRFGPGRCGELLILRHRRLEERVVEPSEHGNEGVGLGAAQGFVEQQVVDVQERVARHEGGHVVVAGALVHLVELLAVAGAHHKAALGHAGALLGAEQGRERDVAEIWGDVGCLHRGTSLHRGRSEAGEHPRVARLEARREGGLDGGDFANGGGFDGGWLGGGRSGARTRGCACWHTRGGHCGRRCGNICGHRGGHGRRGAYLAADKGGKGGEGGEGAKDMRHSYS